MRPKANHERQSRLWRTRASHEGQKLLAESCPGQNPCNRLPEGLGEESLLV